MRSQSLKIATGLSIGFQRWSNGVASTAVTSAASAASAAASTTAPADASCRVLCLHGWLDNSNSFSFLGPYLSEHLPSALESAAGDLSVEQRISCEIVAMDHVGHGFSDHQPHMCIFSSYVSHVKGFMDALGWDKAHIIGHSMGANIAMTFAGCFPEMVDKLVLMEGIGPTSKPASECNSILRRAIVADLENGKRASKKKRYESFESAVDARVRIVSTYPGTQTISQEAARSILSRGLSKYPEESQEEKEGGTTSTPDNIYSGPVYFHHDSRLVLPSYQYFTEEQMDSFIRDITSPTLLLWAENGWPVPPELDYAKRPYKFSNGILTSKRLPGSHHFHIDPPSSAAVAADVLSFLSRSSTNSSNA